MLYTVKIYICVLLYILDDHTLVLFSILFFTKFLSSKNSISYNSSFNNILKL